MMLRRHHSYPNLTAMLFLIAACNGMLHRESNESLLLNAAFSAIEADGADSEDVGALEDWLGTLTEEQKLVLADGEETERELLVNQSPIVVQGNALLWDGLRLQPSAVTQRVALLLDDAYEAVLEVENG